MSNLVKAILVALLLSAVAATGYWYGTTSAEFRVPSAEGKAERKLLYYRNPMGLPDTSPVPKKDAMGMDYVAVYEGEEPSSAVVSISTDKIQKLGVRSEAAALRELNATLRATGRIEIDERRLHTIAPKFEGWVERLYVNTTGQAVGKGQALFDVYSPELLSAQREHALAVQGLAALKDADAEAKQSMQRLVDAGAARLKNWNMAGTDSAQGITFRAPANGIVIEKKAVQGMRFMPGEMLYQIADLSSVWVIAEVAERDIGQVQKGAKARVTVDAGPERVFEGRVDFIYPTLNEATRTVQVRIQVANPGGLLKPAMYAQVHIDAGKGGKVLTVPDSAVIDSGTRQVVLVRLAEGRFAPRTVTLGSRSDDHVEIVSGITEGEQVVTSANFLIDAESNLKAALRGMGDVPQGTLTPTLSQGERGKQVGHQAQGMLEAVNADGTVSITHDPIPALKWPSMTMDFALANPSLAANIKPGSAIEFEIVERGEGEWVVTKLQVQHKGH
ncbi:MAG: efflux RND transporter periplasmic adaptor subunit [Nitrosomonadales bacterium]|nr:efflux RND transporter periplasmic adaptor subunit [Nitrosomonadales bacterium]